MGERACDHCGASFKTRDSRKRFCSKKCNCAFWFQRHPERVRELNRRWVSQNKDRRATRRREHRLENAEAIREYNRAYHAQNRESVHERQRTWKKANPAAGLAANVRRRARKLGAQGSHTTAEWLAICKKQRGKCADCKLRKPLARDHVVPLSRGGTDFAYNIQGLCKSCNSRKKAKLMDYAHPSLFDGTSGNAQTVNHPAALCG